MQEFIQKQQQLIFKIKTIIVHDLLPTICKLSDLVKVPLLRLWSEKFLTCFNFIEWLKSESLQIVGRRLWTMMVFILKNSCCCFWINSCIKNHYFNTAHELFPQHNIIKSDILKSMLNNGLAGPAFFRFYFYTIL